MASPVDTTVKWARSDMPGAPTLTAQAGSLIGLLDAVLVNGWGLQSATSVVVAGGVATATFAADHAAFVHAVVAVSGATPAGLNGEQKVTAVEPNKISWATSEPDGTATGAITVKMAPVGWLKPFSGSNLAAYKSASQQSAGLFLRVNDSNALYARVAGYETMSAISTGSNLFPTNAQASGGLYWVKGPAASTTPLRWLLCGDARLWHLFVLSEEITYNNAMYAGSDVYSFGDILSHNAAGHPFGVVVSGNPSPFVGGETLNGNGTGVFCARRVSGQVGATGIYPGYVPSREVVFPDPAFGGARLQPVRLSEQDASGFAWATTGTMPGVFQSEATGVQALLGVWPVLRGGARQYLLQLHAGQTADARGSRSVALDITGPWR